MFQFWASVADGCPVLNQYCVFGIYRQLKPFKCYKLNNSCNSF